MINEDELEELVLRALGLTDEEYEKFVYNDGDTEILLLEKKELCIDDFRKVVEMLLPFSVKSESRLTGAYYQGFFDYRMNSFILKEGV